MKKNNRTLARRAPLSRHLPVRRDAGGKRHTILPVFHVLIAFVLMGLILVHLGKEADAGAALGSGDRRPDIEGGRPVIGVGVKKVSSATDSRMDDYVPKSEYEKRGRWKPSKAKCSGCNKRQRLRRNQNLPLQKPLQTNNRSLLRPPHLKRALAGMTRKNLKPRKGTAARRRRRPKGNWTSFYAPKSFYSGLGRSN
jgi:hypothetical protein